MDLDRLESEPTDLVSERLRELFSDLVLKIPMAGEDTYVCAVLEHQSTPEPLMPFRFLESSVALWRDLLANEPNRKSLPAILSVLVQNGAMPWRSPRRMSELYDLKSDLVSALGPHLPELAFFVDDLTAQSEDEISSRVQVPYLRLALLSLRSRGKAPSPVHRSTWVECFRELRRAGNQGAIEAILRYYLAVAVDSRSEVVDALVAEAPELREDYVSLYDRILQEGAEKGRAEGRVEGHTEGRAEGRVEGKVTLLEKQLLLKFGELPAEVRSRLSQASGAELERWAERILFASSLAELFGDKP